MFKVGEKVFLDSDPRKESGIVIAIAITGIYVRWNSGRQWVYNSEDLCHA